MSEDVGRVNWFPGHMAKTKRKIQENLKFVDAVVEIADARIPESSRNPDLDSIINGKPRILILNKCDMADPKLTQKWMEHYLSLGIATICLDSKSGKGLSKFIPCMKKVLNDKILNYKKKGFVNKKLKFMVVGIPNVGKSSFINKLIKEKRAKTADKPGVTRGNQWFSVGQNFELLDTPGVLWPKIDDPIVGQKLAFYGSIKDDILDIENLACDLIDALKKDYSNLLKSRYDLESDTFFLKSYEILNQIALKRGFFMSKGELDIRRTANMILDEFRAAKLGKITLDLI